MLELIQDEPLSLFQLPFMCKNQIQTFWGDICQAWGQGSHHECPREHIETLSFCPSMIIWVTEQRGVLWRGGWGLRRWGLCFINAALSWGAQEVPTNCGCCSSSALITFMSQTVCTSNISLKAWNRFIKSLIPLLTSPKACFSSAPFVLDPAGDILYSNQLPHSPIGSEQTRDVAWTCFRPSSDESNAGADVCQH